MPPSEYRFGLRQYSTEPMAFVLSSVLASLKHTETQHLPLPNRCASMATDWKNRWRLTKAVLNGEADILIYNVTPATIVKPDKALEYGLRQDLSEEPNIFTLIGIKNSLQEPQQYHSNSSDICIGNKNNVWWVPARNISLYARIFKRLRLAFEVFCGRADILYYR